MKANAGFKLRNLRQDNRAQAAGAVTAVIVLIVGFAVAGLLFTFTQVLGGQTYEIVEDDLDEINSYTAANHTFTARNDTWVLINASLKSGSLTIYNGTGWTDNTSNFSVNYTTGYVRLISSNVTLNGTSMYADYEYDDGTIRTAIKNGVLSNFEAQEQIGNYMPIIALAIIITIVIGLIIGGIASRFMGSGPRQGFGGYNNLL